MIDVEVKQEWSDRASERLAEEFKAGLVEFLNSTPIDRQVANRWQLSGVSEGDVAYVYYDEKPVLTVQNLQKALRIRSVDDYVGRYDDIMFAIRHIARLLQLNTYSNLHNARIVTVPNLALDHTLFYRMSDYIKFFEKSQFIPRYAQETVQQDGNQLVISLRAPYFFEHKKTGEIHIANTPMLQFLLTKEDQTPNKEFTYKVADSMADFAKKYDFGLIPLSFYANYGKPANIVNATDFDIENISRKVFIDPYVWDYDTDTDPRFFQNVKNGMHFMDKIRKGETLNSAVRRILREELKVPDDYVGIRIWGIDFDRDRDGILTPRLKMNIYVHGLEEVRRSKTHDWVSLKKDETPSASA